MELKQLKYLLSVSELGSFSKAAVVLSVAQPVLSRQIRSLEEELGVELLYRNGRGIVVSDAGQIVVEHARAIVSSVGSISADIDTLRSDPSGKISIGMPPTAGSVLTAPLIQRFHEEYPRIKLKVQEGYSGHVLEWLSTGRIDVAILYNAPKTSTLLTQPLIEEELLLIGPGRKPDMAVEGPVNGASLAEMPLILPSHPHGLRVLVEFAVFRPFDPKAEHWQRLPDLEIERHAFGAAVADGRIYALGGSYCPGIKQNGPVGTHTVESLPNAALEGD